MPYLSAQARWEDRQWESERQSLVDDAARALVRLKLRILRDAAIEVASSMAHRTSPLQDIPFDAEGFYLQMADALADEQHFEHDDTYDRPEMNWPADVATVWNERL